MKTPPYWASDEHALMAGMLMGHFMANGIVCSFATDAEGNYMNELIISLEPGLDSLRVKVEVLPY